MKQMVLRNRKTAVLLALLLALCFAVMFSIAVKAEDVDVPERTSGDIELPEIPILCDHEWGEWTVVKKPTPYVEGTEERVCRICGEKETRTIPKEEIKTGLYKVNNQWRYYEKGVFVKKTGLVKRPDTGVWYYVENGIYTKSTGVAAKAVNTTDKRLFYVKSGSLQTSYTGEAKGIKNNKLYYVTKGKVNTENGLYRAGDKWKYYENGVFAKKTGMVKRPDTGKWYYVEQGLYNNKATGMVKRISDGKWFYVEKGTFKKATGMVKRISDGKWFYVEKGTFKKVTGAVRRVSDGKWFYVKNGVYNNKATGLGKRLDKNEWLYFENGKFKSGFTGTAKKIDGGSTKYKVKNGKLVK